jgi:orotidine-5'-phosphate decarboxylase
MIEFFYKHNSPARDKVVFALDNIKTIQEMKEIVLELRPYIACFKVGYELVLKGAFQKQDVLGILKEMGVEVFYDMKLNDIPNTMRKATEAISANGANILTVHAQSGKEGMKAAVSVRGETKIYAVTVLTSFNQESFSETFDTDKKLQEEVLRFATLAQDAGVDGVIASPQELVLLKSKLELANLKIITPGIRPLWADAGDQARPMTPGDAIKNGAHKIVVGRPIMEAANRVDAVRKILEEIENAL